MFGAALQACKVVATLHPSPQLATKSERTIKRIVDDATAQHVDLQPPLTYQPGRALRLGDCYDLTMQDERRNTPAPFAASILALNGELEGQRFPLKTLQYVGLVHCSDSEICLPSTALGTSRRHLSLECVDGRFIVADFHSGMGTFVNGERISEPRGLAHGDIIAAGRAEFRFELG